MHTPICAAIKKMRLVQFNYDGLPRFVEPYSFGITPEGLRVLCGYQVAGESNSGNLGWKVFREDGIIDLAVLPDCFEQPREGYRKNGKEISTILCQLESRIYS